MSAVKRLGNKAGTEAFRLQKLLTRAGDNQELIQNSGAAASTLIIKALEKAGYLTVPADNLNQARVEQAIEAVAEDTSQLIKVMSAEDQPLEPLKPFGGEEPSGSAEDFFETLGGIPDPQESQPASDEIPTEHQDAT